MGAVRSFLHAFPQGEQYQYLIMFIGALPRNPRFDKTFRRMAKIGYIPQNLGLVRNTSVLDNEQGKTVKCRVDWLGGKT